MLLPTVNVYHKRIGRLEQDGLKARTSTDPAIKECKDILTLFAAIKPGNKSDQQGLQYFPT